MSSVSLGVQEIMLILGETLLLQVLLAINVSILLLMLWIKKLRHKVSFDLLFKMFVILSFLRFAIPMMVLCNEVVYEYALEPKYEEAVLALETTQIKSKKILEEVQKQQKKDKSWIDTINVSKQINNIRSQP
jgi:hypothetical protein